MDTHKIIAVYGNGGSYKTSTAVSLAKLIAEIDNEADVMLVGLDSTKPLLPLIFPNKKGTAIVKTSLGKLLANEHLDQETIVAQTAMAGKIGVLAYNMCENVNSYAYPTDNRADDFFMQLRHLVNYTIVDCTASVSGDMLTAKALINADEVVQLVSCDLNGLVFVQSQETLLQGHQFSYANYRRVLTVTGRFAHDEDGMRNAVTKIIGTIPYSAKIAEAWNCGNAFETDGEKDYRATLTLIAETLVDYEEADDDETEDIEYETDEETDSN